MSGPEAPTIDPETERPTAQTSVDQPQSERIQTTQLEQQQQWGQLVDQELLPHFQRAHRLMSAAWNAIESDTEHQLRDAQFFRDREARIEQIHRLLLEPIEKDSERIGAQYGPLMRNLMNSTLHDFGKSYVNSISVLRICAYLAEKPTWSIDIQQQKIHEAKRSVVELGAVSRAMLLKEFEKTIEIMIGGKQKPEHFFGQVEQQIRHYFSGWPEASRSLYNIRLHRQEASQSLLVPAASFAESITRELVINAIEAMGERGGTIDVTLASAPNGVTVSISDDGPGMTPEVWTNMFKRGFTTKKTGTGHGLANTRELVEDILGGGIAVESEVGRGTTIRVTIPSDLSKVLTKITALRRSMIGSESTITNQEAA